MSITVPPFQFRWHSQQFVHSAWSIGCRTRRKDDLDDGTLVRSHKVHNVDSDRDKVVSGLWGLGFVKVKRVKGNTWRYLLKYVVKGTGALPSWVLDYPKRIRVFQTSVGFYDSPSPAAKKAADPEPTGANPRTLRQRFGDWEGSASVRSFGAGRFSQRVRLH